MQQFINNVQGSPKSVKFDSFYMDLVQRSLINLSKHLYFTKCIKHFFHVARVWKRGLEGLVALTHSYSFILNFKLIVPNITQRWAMCIKIVYYTQYTDTHRFLLKIYYIHILWEFLESIQYTIYSWLKKYIQYIFRIYFKKY